VVLVAHCNLVLQAHPDESENTWKGYSFLWSQDLLIALQ